MPGRVMVTGGGGFVGSAVIDELLSRDYGVNALVNRRPLASKDSRVRSIPGGIFDPAAVDEAARGCDAVIHLVGIIMEKPSQGVTFERMHFEGTKAIVDGAIRNDIKRYVQMSALGVRPDAASNYHRTKFLAEQYVRVSGLKWTIIRPSLIHGPRGEFMAMEARWARKQAAPFLFMPYFGRGLLGGGGAGQLQPVFVGDVAKAFVDALDKNQTIGEVYMIGGPEEITWPAMHKTVSRHIIGRERATLAVPAWYAKLLTYVVPGGLLPFNHDQVVMSQEDNTCDISKLVADFGWTPHGFEEQVKLYAHQL